uniref:Uncharacterized protein n=1 Tax=Oryza sativa subsp. japonica TaxID=39947 RepID=Q9FWD3_ORYSJ|nr:hypothetical protein [Oryza sativa Japonica Group]
MLAPWYEGRRHFGWRPLRPSQHLHDSPIATVARARRQCGWRRHVGIKEADREKERHNAVFDLAGCGFEEEGYPVVDYESALQTAKSTTVR